jgi:hypothetical protein
MLTVTSSSASDSLLVQPDEDELEPLSSTRDIRSDVDVDVDEVVSVLIFEYIVVDDAFVCRRCAVESRRAIPRTAEDSAAAVDELVEMEAGKEVVEDK